MSPVTTHILDTARGRPAAGVSVRLERGDAEGGWVQVGGGVTDDDGRVRDLCSANQIEAGVYRIEFATGDYFAACGASAAFYPSVTVVFRIDDPGQHFHVPLLLSPFGYSTYRGS